MGKPIRVLIVEDSETDALLLVRELRRGSFEPEFERVDTRETMTGALADQKWDLVISDYAMPNFSGIAALELIKKSDLDVPFIIVSGNIGEDVAVAAMKAGAHDYIMKNNLCRLIPSIERELREAKVRCQRRRAEEESRQRSIRLTTLHETNLAIISTLNVGTVLDILLENIALTLPNIATTVRLIHKESGFLERVACRNIDEKQWKAMKVQQHVGLAKLVLESKTPIAVSNVQTDPRSTASEFARKEGLVSYLGVPLIAKSEALGIIAFYTRDAHPFADDDTRFLVTLAGQAAMSIYNARLYEETKKQMIELEKANKVKEEFLSIMSHELRTPLNVSMGYISMIKDRLLGETNSEQDNALEMVLKHSHELLAMINGVLAVGALEAKAVKIKSEQVNLVNLLDDLKVSSQIRLDKQISLLWDYSPDLPIIGSDRNKLKHILQNLIINAIKFTEKGHVALAARFLCEANAVEFKVADTGIGISKEKLSIVFEMFRQLDSSVTRSYGGMGIGLFIVKKFTEMLGGTVAVESELDKGSTFTITIPARITVQSPVGNAAPLSPLSRAL